MLEVASLISFGTWSLDIKTSLLRSSSIFGLETRRLDLLSDEILMHDADTFIALAITLKESRWLDVLFVILSELSDASCGFECCSLVDV